MRTGYGSLFGSLFAPVGCGFSSEWPMMFTSSILQVTHDAGPARTGTARIRAIQSWDAVRFFLPCSDRAQVHLTQPSRHLPNQLGPLPASTSVYTAQTRSTYVPRSLSRSSGYGFAFHSSGTRDAAAAGSADGEGFGSGPPVCELSVPLYDANSRTTGGRPVGRRRVGEHGRAQRKDKKTKTSLHHPSIQISLPSTLVICPYLQHFVPPTPCRDRPYALGS